MKNLFLSVLVIAIMFIPLGLTACIQASASPLNGGLSGGSGCCGSPVAAAPPQQTSGGCCQSGNTSPSSDIASNDILAEWGVPPGASACH